MLVAQNTTYIAGAQGYDFHSLHFTGDVVGVVPCRAFARAEVAYDIRIKRRRDKHAIINLIACIIAKTKRAQF